LVSGAENGDFQEILFLILLGSRIGEISFQTLKINIETLYLFLALYR